MPIVGRTPQECFAQFVEHVRGLVAKTVTERHPVGAIPDRATRLQIGFREELPIAVPIDTGYGRLYFWLSQALEAVPRNDGRYQLKTRQYWYRVQLEPDLRNQALIRWEYDSTTPRHKYARHHAHIAGSVPLPDGKIELDKVHVPTGYVTMEEVIRFLIVDLGMTPPCGEEWPTVIEASEAKFYEDFTGKWDAPGAPQPARD